MTPLLLSLLVLGATPDGGAAPASDAGPPPDPVATRRLLGEERARLNQLLDRQASVLDALDAASRSVAQAEAESATARAEERAAKARLEQAEADAKGAAAALSARIQALEPRLLARYRLEHGGAAELLLSSSSLSDLLWRRRTLDAVLAGDLELLKVVKEDAERLAQAQRDQTAREAEHQHRLRELEVRLPEARHRRDQLSALLAAVEAQKEAREKTLQELAQAAARLEILAAPAPMGYVGKANFEGQKGRLPFPVDGEIEVKFGRVVNPRFHTAVMQKGLDLRADEGSPVRSVAPGKVVHAAWLRGYGNLLIVDHGAGFFTLYAHLADLERKVGDEVQRGDRLGGVGETGSLKGPYLYFEIRHHGTPLNPGLWLQRPPAPTLDASHPRSP